MRQDQQIVAAGTARAWFGVHLATLLFSGVVVGWLGRDLWFFLDEFEFFSRRVGAHPEGGLWEPHNEHWSTLPVLAYRALYALFGLRSFLPYLVVLVAVHVAVVHVVWRVCRRVGAGEAAAAVAALTLGVLGAGWENLTWAFQIGFLGSLLATWWQTILVDHDGGWGRRDVAGWLVGVGGMLCAGVSVPLLVVPVLTALLRRGVRVAVATGAVPAAVFLAWYTTAGQRADAPGGGLSVPPPGLVVGYLWTGIDWAAQDTVGVPYAGPVLAGVLVLAAAFRVLPLTGRASAATAGLVGVPTLYAFISLGRASFGTEQARASRYVYLAAALALPAMALLAGRLSARLRLRLPDRVPARFRSLPVAGAVLLTAGLVVAGHGVVLLRQRAHEIHVRDANSRTNVYAAVALIRSGAPVYDGLNADPIAGFSQFGALRRLDADGAFPRDLAVTPSQLAHARLRGQVLLIRGDGDPAPSRPPRVSAGRGTVVRPGARPGCVVMQAASRSAPPAWTSLVIHTTGAPGQLTLVPSHSTLVRAQWQDPVQGVRSGSRKPLTVPIGTPGTLSYLAETGQVVLQVRTPSEVEVCGSAGVPG